MEQHLGTATSNTLFHQFRDLWNSPRGTVIRIQALGMVAIVCSFVLAFFGSCRRWSNHWVFQKGYLVATGLSLSVGTYCIGLMQTSSVKSEMYPIWCVSLFTLFGCVDTLSGYSLDQKSQLWKTIFQLCLYFGYVLLISVSNISNKVGMTAISMLVAITFIKCFHRSLALVLPLRMRDMLGRCLPCAEDMETDFFRVFLDQWPNDDQSKYKCNFPVDLSLDDAGNLYSVIGFKQIWRVIKVVPVSDATTYRDLCLSLALSFMLQARFFGLTRDLDGHSSLDQLCMGWLMEQRDGIIGYDWAFRLIEVELAFLYDYLFCSNAFVHYHQAKAAIVWSFASVSGICFVGVAAAIPGAWSTSGSSAGTIVVKTTTADLTVTLVIVASLALLQGLQLLYTWTSNWSRVALACDYVRVNKESGQIKPSCRMKLKAFLHHKMNWLDRYSWQNKLGQYSFLESISIGTRCVTACCCRHRFTDRREHGHDDDGRRATLLEIIWGTALRLCTRLKGMLGFLYVDRALRELWLSSTGDAVELHPDVKEAVAKFLGKLGEAKDWPSLLQANGVLDVLAPVPGRELTGKMVVWHIATCYCELAQRKRNMGSSSFSDDEEWTLGLDGKSCVEKNHRVATTLSKYCAYLCISAPELLPGVDPSTKSIFPLVSLVASRFLYGKDKLEEMKRMRNAEVSGLGPPRKNQLQMELLRGGVILGMDLEENMSVDERWEALAKLWVAALLCAAPSENVEPHIRHLSQGGEFITHLWALLTHSGITKWQPQRPGDISHQQPHQIEPEPTDCDEANV